MKRSVFLSACAAASVAGIAGVPSIVQASQPFDPRPGKWRTFRVVTEVRLASGKPAQAWIPIPSFAESDWMRPGATTWDGNAQSAGFARDARWSASFVRAQWPAQTTNPHITVTSYVSTRNLYADLQRPQRPAPLTAAQRELYLSPTKYIPTDGVVKQYAHRITAGASTEVEKARKIYNWIVENTYRKASVRGCGLGDVSFLLESGDLGGKCADLNGLAVGLARASGIPARDLYGVRVAPSRFGFKSLGVHSDVITHAQHCRSEVYLADYGWVPIDPADVRKVILDEPPGHLPPSDPKVAAARKTLFGAWEGNYAAFNDASDIALPGSKGPTIPFLMYPQAEIAGERLDSLDPETFIYVITSHEA